jgi:hypothetical protein
MLLAACAKGRHAGCAMHGIERKHERELIGAPARRPQRSASNDGGLSEQRGASAKAAPSGVRMALMPRAR